MMVYSQIWLNLPRDDHHFSHTYGWLPLWLQTKIPWKNTGDELPKHTGWYWGQCLLHTQGLKIEVPTNMFCFRFWVLFSIGTCSSVIISTIIIGTLYIYKQGWKSIHKRYKACPSKCKHTQGKCTIGLSMMKEPRNLQQPAIWCHMWRETCLVSEICVSDLNSCSVGNW